MTENERFRDENEESLSLAGLSQSDGNAGRNEQFPMIAKTMAELEDVLAEELIALGADNVEIGTRMVSFTGNKALMYKANLHCRTALRILKPIYHFKAENADEVYEAVKQVNWEDYLSLGDTFSIDAVVFSHIFNHSKFVTYRVKDAISDWFTEKYDKRPSVSLTNPDIVFNIHISHNKCTLSLDSSGESLHKRGYRVAQTEAPLSEVLAAGMILKSGWRGECAFVDPMCGSGTLLIEAAMIALGIPPGIHRQHFAFEKWKDFDEELFSTIYNDDSGARELKHRIIGSDISPQAIAIAEKNIKNAGLKKHIDLSVKSFQQYNEAPASGGVLITNPPYGERLKVEELEELYAMIGERLKHVFTGFTAYILSYRKESFDAIGLKHNRRFFLYNGALECEMREYEIFSGKRREHPRSNADSDKHRRNEYLAERNSREGYRRSKRDEQAEDDASRGGSSRLPGRRVDTESRPGRRFDAGNRPAGRSFDGEKKFPRRSYDAENTSHRRSFDAEGKSVKRSFDAAHKPAKRSFGESNQPRDFKKKDYSGKGDAPFAGRRKGGNEKKELTLRRPRKKNE